MTNIAIQPWRHAAATPEKAAVIGSGRTWSYAEVRDHTARVAGALQAAGVAPGDRVLLVVPSVPEFMALYHGVLGAGAVMVAVNTVATRYEIDYVLEDAGISLVLAWDEAADAAQEVATARGIPTWRIGPELTGLGAGEPLAEPVDRDLEDTALILYTSGTTGRPKGAMLTQGNIQAAATTFLGELSLSPDDVYFTALPLFHIFGGAVVMGTTMQAGATLTLLARFDARETLEILARDKATVMAGVPTMWNAMLQVGDVDADFSGLRLCLSGGAALPEEVLRAFTERFGAVILEGYGLTECTGAATFNGVHRVRKPGAVGIALPGSEVRIVDDAGAEVGVGEVGEVILRSPFVMKGYWNRPDATAEALRDGWLYTGDFGTMDEDGDVRIVDRKKDLIIRGGMNVYPREVEEILYEHPDVVEVAVVGVPDERLGEEVGAVVATREGVTIDPQDLQAWVRERLSPYKTPRRFAFVEALPKGPTGKILKRAIDRESLEAVAPRPTVR